MFYGDFEFIPVPVYSETVEVFRDAKLDLLFKRTAREFTGTLLGPPASGSSFVDLFDQKESLKDALSSGNQEFRINFDGQPIVSGEFPRIDGPTFAEGTWVDRIDYTFSMELDSQFEGGDAVQSFSETWSFQENEDRRSATVSHDLNAVGLNTNPSGTNNALTNATTFVLGLTGFANVPAGHPMFVQVSGIGLGFSSFEELRTETVDVQTGSFGVSESFILSSGNFLHTRTAQFQTGEDGVTSVSLQGNIKGLGRDGDDIAFNNALAAYNNTIKPLFPASASGVYQEFGGEAILFTSNPISTSTTRNSFVGTIDYSVSFNDSASSNLPSGILEFALNVQEQDAVRVFASFPIMERALGNVVQDVATSTEGSISLQGNAVGKPGFSFNNLLVFVEDQINASRPDPNDFQTLRPGSKQITKDESNNRVQFNVSYIFTKELSQVFGDASGPIVIT
jgi:hypothetical protein